MGQCVYFSTRSQLVYLLKYGGKKQTSNFIYFFPPLHALISQVNTVQRMWMSVICSQTLARTEALAATWLEATSVFALMAGVDQTALKILMTVLQLHAAQVPHALTALPLLSASALLERQVGHEWETTCRFFFIPNSKTCWANSCMSGCKDETERLWICVS